MTKSERIDALEAASLQHFEDSLDLEESILDLKDDVKALDSRIAALETPHVCPPCTKTHSLDNWWWRTPYIYTSPTYTIDSGNIKMDAKYETPVITSIVTP